MFARCAIYTKKNQNWLVVRAGVMNKEMVQALGINIQKVFMFVFMIGSGMAALGGVLLDHIPV